MTLASWSARTAGQHHPSAVDDLGEQVGRPRLVHTVSPEGEQLLHLVEHHHHPGATHARLIDPSPKLGHRRRPGRRHDHTPRLAAGEHPFGQGGDDTRQQHRGLARPRRADQAQHRPRDQAAR